MPWNGHRSGLLHSDGDWGPLPEWLRYIGPERTHVGGCEPGEPCNLRPEREWVKDLDKADISADERARPQVAAGSLRGNPA
jgi:hypothetical protein